MQKIKTDISKELQHIYSSEEIRILTRMTLEHVLNLSAVDLLNYKFSQISDDEIKKIEEFTSRLKKKEPIQYILGETEFFNLKFKVNPNVLIPRPETEELIEWVLALINNKPVKVLDIGTGSGCIAVTIAKNAKQSAVSAWDISDKALKTAEENAKLNEVHIDFSKKDILNIQNHPALYDFIVSNPPYIANNEKSTISLQVLDYEPHAALFVSDENPLIFYEKISDFAKKHLTSRGALFFEIHQNYGAEVIEMLRNRGFIKIELRKDISGNDRMIKAERGN